MVGDNVRGGSVGRGRCGGKVGGDPSTVGVSVGATPPGDDALVVGDALFEFEALSSSLGNSLLTGGDDSGTALGGKVVGDTLVVGDALCEAIGSSLDNSLLVIVVVVVVGDSLGGGRGETTDGAAFAAPFGGIDIDNSLLEDGDEDGVGAAVVVGDDDNDDDPPVDGPLLLLLLPSPKLIIMPSAKDSRNSLSSGVP